MQVFVEKFREEVKEYLDRLEAGLLILENNPENKDVIEEVFRIMHSMKGSGGMFGFDLLSEVTHDLETLFDIFRSKKRVIDSITINFTLSSIDILSDLLVLEPLEHHKAIANSLKNDTLKQISRILGQPDILPRTNIEKAETENLLQNKKVTYYISFVPNTDLLINGTNPLFLIDELNAIGECKIEVNIDLIPELTDLETTNCYINWQIVIATSENIDTINDVFIFVTDNSVISIDKIANYNVLNEPEIISAFLNSRIKKTGWYSLDEEIKEIVQVDTKEEPIEEINQEAKSIQKPDLSFNLNSVESIRVSSQKIDHYMNLVSELITTQSRLETLSQEFKSPELELVIETYGKLSRQLRDNAFDMSLIPLQTIAVRFKRLIHDLSISLDKEVVLETLGMETELDKNIIEKLMEPLLHIIRNSVDHGIENKNLRKIKNKNEKGKILIKASTIGSYVQIEIEDDGAGLNKEKIREKAVSKGLILDQSKYPDNEIYNLIFEPGFSTSELVTDVSGRGVGMDVVKRRINEMSGSILIETEIEKFTRITIRLPLSLSIIDGLLTTVGNNFFVIPSAYIKKIHNIKREKLKKEFRQVIEIDNLQFPYVDMHTEFEGDVEMPEEQFVIVVSFENQLFGLVVDQVVREYQAVIKPLGKLLKGQDIFSGASILGTGQLALVIEPNKMIKKYS